MSPRVLLFDLKQNVDFKNFNIQDHDNYDYQSQNNINWYINIIFLNTILKIFFIHITSLFFSKEWEFRNI